MPVSGLPVGGAVADIAKVGFLLIFANSKDGAETFFADYHRSGQRAFR
jgi:hypothetical protein